MRFYKLNSIRSLTDESYIKLSLEIAKKGTGNVSPNPLVGCVLIKDDRIIGAGFHERFGGNHAEINAFENASEDIDGSTLYVNLEPCSHFGKTPPCVDKIIEKKVKRVVIGTMDMNPLVSGQGIKKLKLAGIDVKVGVLENECISMNKFFFKYITQKLPYVTLKAAQTLDGKIADDSGRSKWISCTASRRYVHKLRAKYDAVMVGIGTVKKDDPSLTVRLTEGRNPKRIVIDTRLDLKLSQSLFLNNHDHNIIVVTSKESKKKVGKIKKLLAHGAQIIYVKESSSNKINLKVALQELAKINITSILVEGGSEIFTSFVKQKLFDDILVFITPKIIGSGLSVVNNLGINGIKQSLKVKIASAEKIGDDVLLELTK